MAGLDEAMGRLNVGGGRVQRGGRGGRVMGGWNRGAGRGGGGWARGGGQGAMAEEDRRHKINSQPQDLRYFTISCIYVFVVFMYF